MPASALTFELELPSAASPGDDRFLGMMGQEGLGRLFEFHIRRVGAAGISALSALEEVLRREGGGAVDAWMFVARCAGVEQSSAMTLCAG